MNIAACPMACADKSSLKLTTCLFINLHVLYEIYSVFDVLVKNHDKIDPRVLEIALHNGNK